MGEDITESTISEMHDLTLSAAEYIVDFNSSLHIYDIDIDDAEKVISMPII